MRYFLKSGIFFRIVLLFLLSIPIHTLKATEKLAAADICIYGETPAGIAAAIQSARMGKSVVLISTTSHVGGMATSGLTATDLNNFRMAGGITREFFQRIYKYYSSSEAWRSETREFFFERSKKRTYSGKNDSLRMQWVYESYVGEKILLAMLHEAGVQVMFDHQIDLSQKPRINNKKIEKMRFSRNLSVEAKVFIDASYEGDLMALAGVSHIVGREPNAAYGETMNGIRLGPVVGKDNVSIDPYITPGDPGSGLLPFIDASVSGPDGSGDKRTQSYCFRMTLTDDPDNRIAITRPKNFDPLLYEFLARFIALNPGITLSEIISFTPMPNRKTDTNQGNFVGMSYAWPNGNHDQRKKIAAQHKSYSLGLLWFLGNDPRLPKPLREEMQKWGLPKDEYKESDHFPYQLYVREARRMISDHVMTQHNASGVQTVIDPIAVATYPMDCHYVARVIDSEGKVRIEGSFGKQKATNYGISYRSIVPKSSEITNLLVPVCLSASHVAYSSIRMEPVFMVLGQSAGTAAVMAIETHSTVQGVDYDALRKKLMKDGQVLMLEKKVNTDIIVYGGTASGVIAAIQAAKLGKKVILVSPETHLGGMTTGGLGYTDTGDKTVIGGLARNFYHRLFNHYQKEEAWQWQKRSEFGNRGQGTVAHDTAYKTMWLFEPHVAERTLEEMIKEVNLEVHRDRWLDRSEGGVVKEGQTIRSIRTLDGTVYQAKQFIDATFEGDLMASANVSYTTGRESNVTYGERWNGVQKGAKHHDHYFKHRIDPYVVPGDPKSGLLPEISNQDPGQDGDGDKKLQAYCFRICMSTNPDNRIPFPKPDMYDPKRYMVLSRLFAAGWRDVFPKFDAIPNRKTDTNNHGPFSSDHIGGNYDYPDATYVRRKEIIKAHEDYQKGYLYFLANDPSVPKDIQDRFNTYGLAKDEFRDNNNWPYQLYVREARRMVSDFVMTEKDALGKTTIYRPVGMGSYSLDSHNTQRYVTKEGFIQNEGDIGVKPDRPYSIDYGAIVPRKGECENLFIPVCVSSSHIAYGSIRMEPVFMILGQSAAAAASLCIDKKTSAQELPYRDLEQLLVECGQVLRK